MNFYESIYDILTCKTPHEKFLAFELLYERYKNEETVFEHSQVKEINEPSYSEICQIVSPKEVSKRRKLQSEVGKKVLLHSVAHIEFSAIDLALDALYRFRDLPKEYYDDWLEVTEDEIRHFKMIEALLHEMNSFYGELNVHNSLFDAAKKTPDFLERMAVVPRHFEANGLDANPEIIEKIRLIKNDVFLDKIAEALEVILKEEVSHVQKGDKWFSYACKALHVDKNIYFEIVNKYYPNAYPRKKNVNIKARLEAGFSCKELNFITSREIC